MNRLEALAESAGFGPRLEPAALTVWQSVPSIRESWGGIPPGPPDMLAASISRTALLAARAMVPAVSRHPPVAPTRGSSDTAPVEDTPIGPRQPRIHLAPTTRTGLWAAQLLILFLAGVVVYIGIAAAYQIITGDEAFDNLRVPLVGVLLTTEVAGVLAGVAAAFAVFRRGERSVLAFVALIVLVFTAIVIVSDLASQE